MTAIFGHRGCAGVPAPRENTLAAFAAARQAGADGVELDVRATADGVLAVHHDRHVPGLGPVTNLVARELPEDVPALEDALAVCAGLLVNVEIKGGAADAVLVARLLLGRARDPRTEATGVFVSSFDPAAVATTRELAPQVATGLLVDWRTDADLGLDHAVRLGCPTLHPFVAQVDPGLVSAARARGLGLHVWTVNADADIAAMGALGVDAVITDRVAAAVGILRAEGAWAGGDPMRSPGRNGGEDAG